MTKEERRKLEKERDRKLVSQAFELRTELEEILNLWYPPKVARDLTLENIFQILQTKAFMLGIGRD